MDLNPLSLTVSQISSVGPKTAAALFENGIFSVFDLILRIPRTTVTQNISKGFRFMTPGDVYIAKGYVKTKRLVGIGSKKRLEVLLEDGTGLLSLIYFGQPASYMDEKFKQNEEVIVCGEVKMFLGRPQMTHPKILLSEISSSIPKESSSYSQIGGIASKDIKKIVDNALKKIDPFDDFEHLDEEVLQKFNLSPLFNAILSVHHPDAKIKDKKQCSNLRRLAFEELVYFYLNIFMSRKKDVLKSKAIKAKKINSLAKEILPFTLTKGQVQALEDIISDMDSTLPMLRLLQGDVGSGKTAVSAIASLSATKEGFQVALMAPTEILAEQLYSVYKEFFKNQNKKIEFLTSSTKNKKRNEIIQELADGKIDILVGTHALLTKDVIFKNLGLFIIDEQHRFGVNQRASILKSCEENQGFSPHLLVMSATPIPRSLALTFYNDLELSVINERPKGRLPIETKIFAGSVIPSLIKMCERTIETNKKAFVIFPLVEESEALDLENATNAYAMLQKNFGADHVLMVHGRMKPQEKQLVMEQFRNSSVNLLVSTSVVEVGVDIKDATVMIIVHPERFGLAQLHQLRGRVGRNDIQSYCFLLTDIANRFSSAYKRLETLCSSQDGFFLAKADLEQRGPGELLGTKQSGALSFNIFNHEDFSDLALPAKIYAKKLLTHPLDLKYSHLLQKNKVYFS